MLFTTIYCMQKQFFSGVLQVVSNNKSFSVGVQSPTEINAPRGCAVILRRICQLSLTRITHQVSRAFDLKYYMYLGNYHACRSILKLTDKSWLPM